MAENQDWKDYENAIYRYYKKQPNCSVQRNIELPTQNGRKRQIDVYLEVKATAEFTFRIAIEAKNYRDKINSDTFDAIRTRFESVGVDMGVIFCPHGLESGPTQDLERYKNPRMELRQKSLDELLAENWGDDVLNAINNVALAKENPAPNELVTEDVVATIERIPLYARFFFYRLENPVWLPILADRGVFSRCLRGENQIPPLLACEFVCKHVGEHPDRFIQFCESVTESFQWLETDLVRAALLLPEAMKLRFLEIAARWPFEHLIDIGGVIELVRDQVRSGNSEVAFNLLSHVTRLIPQNPEVEDTVQWKRLEAAASANWFQELTLGLYPEMVADQPSAVVRYARRRFVDALALSRPHEPTVLPTFGGVANLAVEGQFGPIGVLATLAFAYRDVLVKLGGIDSRLLADLVKEDIIQRKNGGLVRAGLYAAGECEQIRVELMTMALDREELWHDYNVVPELEHLVECAWPALSDELREAVVRRAMTLGKFRYRSDNISGDDAEKYRKGHVIDWLLLLEELGLPPSIQAEAVAMRRAYSGATGKIARFEHLGVQGRIVDPTPEDARSFADMKAEDVLAYCARFEATLDFLERKTPEGVASQLRLEVEHRPSEFLEHPAVIVRLPYPAYHSAVADGLTEALRTGAEVDRVAATKLLSTMITERHYKPLQGQQSNSFEYGESKWVRSAVARFLEEAAQNDPDPLRTQQVLFELWELLWQDADLSPGVQGDVDALTEVVNSEGGHLSIALCRFALRVSELPSDGLTPEDQASRAAWTVRLLDAVDNYLLPSPNVVVRAPLGLFFTGFFRTARSWVEARTDRIFDCSNPVLWEAAWSCHFWVTQRFKDAFLHLRKHYEYALEMASDDGSSRRGWISQLGDDMAIFWLAGVLEPGDPLLDKFWRTAPGRAKSSAALWLNATLKRNNWSELWPKAKEWWQKSCDFQNDTDTEGTLSHFLRWLDSAPDGLTVGEVEALVIASVQSEAQYFGDHVFDFLDARVQAEPMACARVFKAIASNSSLHLHFGRDDRMKSLMYAIYEAGGGDVKSVLREAKVALVSAGYFSYRDVLEGESC